MTTGSSPGRMIANRYLLEHQLGRGGMASVWKARHLALQAPVAVKLLDPALAESSEARFRFMREAQATAALRSEHVVQVLDYGMEDDEPYIVMELLEGRSLADLLRHRRVLSVQETARVLRQVAAALTKAHEAGIVHRDLTPENVFLVSGVGDDDFGTVKMLDFGVAKWRGPASEAPSVSTLSGTVLGTPYYMSPEQLQGSSAVDRQSDVWSFGVIAFECLTGRVPFDGTSLASLAVAIVEREPPVPSSLAGVPLGFDAWFARAVHRDPAQRWLTIQDAADALCNIAATSARESAHERLQVGLPSDTKATPPAHDRSQIPSSIEPHVHDATALARNERAEKRDRRRQYALRAGAAVLACSAVVLAVTVPSPRRATESRRDETGHSARQLPLPAQPAPQSPVVEPSVTPSAPAQAPPAKVALPTLGVELSVPEAVRERRGPASFGSPDGVALVTVTAVANERGRKLEELYTSRALASNERTVEYAVQRDDWFVVSGFAGELIYYEKFVERSDGERVALSITFPRDQKPRFERAVEQLSHSFRSTDWDETANE